LSCLHCLDLGFGCWLAWSIYAQPVANQKWRASVSLVSKDCPSSSKMQLHMFLIEVFNFNFMARKPVIRRYMKLAGHWWTSFVGLSVFGTFDGVFFFITRGEHLRLASASVQRHDKRRGHCLCHRPFRSGGGGGRSCCLFYSCCFCPLAYACCLLGFTCLVCCLLVVFVDYSLFTVVSR
jgi:hypothetical protein